MTRRACILFLAVVAALPATAAGAEPKRVPFQRAVTLVEWGPSAYEPGQVRATLRRLKRQQRVDTVTIAVTWEQRDGSSTRIAPGPRAATPSRVRGAIRAAKALRMRVVLRPYVDREDNGWRGQITPTSVPSWFASYRRFINTYAAIARRERVDGFVVGSEMVTLSDEEARWRAVVRGVRKRFRGWVTYQANWGGEETAVRWWDAVDVISISAYYPVAARPGLSATQLAAGWHSLIDQWGDGHTWVGRIDALRTRWNRPVMFGEIGYRPVPETAMEPWNILLNGRDDRAQPAAYEAALRTWYRVPWFRGMHWWYVAPNGAALDGHLGADHRPGKAALRTIRRWYARPPR